MKWLARLLPAFALVVATAAFALTPGQRTVILGGCPSALQLNGGTCAPIVLNFVQNIGRGANGIVQAATSLVTVTRNSIHTCSDTSGNWYQVIANVLCRTNQGALIEEARTNSIETSAPSGGTFPSTWFAYNGGLTGLTFTTIGTGVENGIAYVDEQVSGTPSGSGAIEIGFNSISASSAQTWTSSAFLKLTSGGWTNVTAIAFNADEYDGASYLATIGNALTNPTGAALGTQRQVSSVLLAAATTTAFVPYLKFNLNGLPINFTIRVGLPQVELNPAPATVASATVASGGTCTPGTYTFTVAGGTGTASTITGTVTGTTLQGTLTITTPGSYSVFPTNPATLNGGTCAVQPTATLTPTNNAAQGYASSPIPTAGSAVTRAADGPPVLVNVPVFGTKFFEYASIIPLAPANYSAAQELVEVSDSSTTNRGNLSRTSANGYGQQNGVGNVTSVSAGYNGATSATTVLPTGVISKTAGTFTTTGAMNKVSIGGEENGAAYCNCYVQKIAVDPQSNSYSPTTVTSGTGP